MRIISGKYKGKRLLAPKKLPIRPTTDMAKEALFNILNNSFHFHGLEVLDLCAGMGTISFEFASRGANAIVCVDVNAGCIKYINQVKNELNIPITTIKSDVIGYLSKTTQKFDIVFADPPYDMDMDKFNTIVELVFSQQLLNDDGVLIIEHSKHTDLSHHAQFTIARRYGGSVFSFFE
ncbi:MAG: 16S rRNA (guanine(966)-N(2))-methyltransferase RsmD [Bacteroidetes bacterium]|jgi:16S rRNA (guanine(966)-N(2))-methyltransferase RsmD|nr:16S rRNA (guanine(966)-N(2))-methyltransferase RsmD [Bacteroidota bacterium]